MTYLNLDSDRLEWLIRNALTGDELKSFFEDCRPQLIIAGEKAQTPPRNPDDAALRICRFSPKAHAVFSKWLKLNRSGDSQGLRTQLTPRFRAMENEGVEFTAKETRKLARCGLDEIYEATPDGSWLKFLSSPMSATTTGVIDNDDAESIIDGLNVIPAPMELLSYARIRAKKAAPDDVVSPVLQSIAKLETALQERDRVYFAQFAELAEDFYRLLDAQPTPTPTAPPAAMPRGITASPPELLSIETFNDYLHLDVIAVPNRISSAGPIFFNVEAFIKDGVVFRLDAESLRRAIPDEGRLILHQDLRALSPKIGTYAAYRVEQFSTHLPIKVRVIGPGVTLHLIVYVPYASAEHDSVREWIGEYLNQQQIADPIFVTSDNLCIRAKGDLHDRRRAATYEWTLDCWDSLKAVEFAGGAYVVGPLSKATRFYDCSPLSSFARKLLKELSEKRIIGLTKQQISDVAQAVGALDARGEEQRRDRLRAQLANLSNSEEDYDGLVEEILKSPVVKTDVNRKVHEIAAQLSADMEREKGALEHVRNEKRVAERSLEKLRETTEFKTKELRLAIKKAFTGAKEKELETLGQLALFQAILGAQNELPKIAQASTPPPLSAPLLLPIAKFEPLGDSLEDVFRSAEFPDPSSSAYGEATAIASSLGMPIVVVGPGANHVGLQIARALCKEAITAVDVYPGAIGASECDSLPYMEEVGNIVIRNANLSDLSLYGRRLLDSLVMRFFGQRAKTTFPPVILTASTGAASLPWPAEICALGAVIYLSADKGANVSTMSNTDADQNSFLRLKCKARVEAAADSDAVSDAARAILLSFVAPAP